MNDKQHNQEQMPEDNQPSTTEESPAQKLEDDPKIGPRVPGAENPESEEIKDEKKPNTE